MLGLDAAGELAQAVEIGQVAGLEVDLARAGLGRFSLGREQGLAGRAGHGDDAIALGRQRLDHAEAEAAAAACYNYAIHHAAPACRRR